MARVLDTDPLMYGQLHSCPIGCWEERERDIVFPSNICILHHQSNPHMTYCLHLLLSQSFSSEGKQSMTYCLFIFSFHSLFLRQESSPFKWKRRGDVSKVQTLGIRIKIDVPYYSGKKLFFSFFYRRNHKTKCKRRWYPIEITISFLFGIRFLGSFFHIPLFFFLQDR